MKIKFLSILLVILAVSFATAPAWVMAGASANYSQGGNAISFTVTGRSDPVIHVTLTTSSPASNGTITENSSAISDQFWIDNSLLGGAYNGDPINGLIVTSIGPQTIGGQTWTAVTLEGSVSGADTTMVYDQQSGLLLKEAVNAQGVSDVVLTSAYMPGVTGTQTQPPPSQPPQTNSTPPSNPPQGSNSGNTTTSPPTSNQSSGNTGQPYQPPSYPSSGGAITQTTPSSSSLPCCPSSFILLLLGFVAIKGRF